MKPEKIKTWISNSVDQHNVCKCTCKSLTLDSLHQYTSSPYCFVFVSYVTYKENLSTHQSWPLFLIQGWYFWEKLDAYHSKVLKG